MARDRIERVLQAFFCTEKEARPTVDVASHCPRIHAHAEDIDGQAEGLFANFFICVGYSSAVFSQPGKRLGSYVACVFSF